MVIRLKSEKAQSWKLNKELEGYLQTDQSSLARRRQMKTCSHCN
jgi:hypothetical protein